MLLAPSLLLAAASPRQDPNPDATVEIEEVRIGLFVVSGSIGGGRLRFRGEVYRFSIDGIGVAGFGVSGIQAQGEVFNLRRVEDFAGHFDVDAAETARGPERTVRVRSLRNAKGVLMRLRDTRSGAILELAPSGVTVAFRS